MKNAFKAMKDNIATRRFGGSAGSGIADPYVTGYHYCWFQNLPTDLPMFTNGNSGLANNDDIQSVLAASCLSVTPPGGTLNKVEFTGLGGIKWAVPGNIDYGNTVSVKFFEMNKTPILDIMHGWVKMIRDYRTGTTGRVKGGDSRAPLTDGDQGTGYSKSTYAGVMFYWTTAPDGVTVEYYACYDGVFPSKDPQDLFTSDVETVGRLDVEIEFNVDYAWHEDWVLAKCKQLSSQFNSSLANVTNYSYK